MTRVQTWLRGAGSERVLLWQALPAPSLLLPLFPHDDVGPPVPDAPGVWLTQHLLPHCLKLQSLGLEVGGGIWEW